MLIIGKTQGKSSTKSSFPKTDQGRVVAILIKNNTNIPSTPALIIKPNILLCASVIQSFAYHTKVKYVSGIRMTSIIKYTNACHFSKLFTAVVIVRISSRIPEPIAKYIQYLKKKSTTVYAPPTTRTTANKINGNRAPLLIAIINTNTHYPIVGSQHHIFRIINIHNSCNDYMLLRTDYFQSYQYIYIQDYYKYHRILHLFLRRHLFFQSILVQ